MHNRSNRQADAGGEPHLSPLADHLDAALNAGGRMRKERCAGEPTPLAVLVSRRLEELELKQSDFCRLTGFDQGLLSKIQNSVITSLSLESALRLAHGLSIPPRVIFGVTDRPDLQELVVRAYAVDFFPELSERGGAKIPAPVLEITALALCAYSMGRSLAPAHSFMSFLAAQRIAPSNNQPRAALPSEGYWL
jgi:transcriptional regulator with XRE-family HTH domain